MNTHSTKSRMAIVSEAIAILSFVTLTILFNRVVASEFNTKLFREQTESMHLKDAKVLEQYKKITDIRAEVNTYIKLDPIFDKYLDEICSNTVGNTMLKLLVANLKIKPDKIITLKQVSGDKAQEEYVLCTSTVHINFDLYDEHGINKHLLCGIDKDTKLIERTGTLSEFLFHELCHAYHDVACIIKPIKIESSTTLIHIYSSTSTKNLWSNDEELFNITGRFYDGVSLGFDPICCNIFDMFNSYKFGNPIVQRVFHSLYSETLKDKLFGSDKFLIDSSLYTLTES